MIKFAKTYGAGYKKDGRTRFVNLFIPEWNKTLSRVAQEHGLKKGDWIEKLNIFPFKENKNQLLIKRIIGMPGETVQIIEGKVYINGYELNENYGNAIIESAGLASEPITLGEDEYFVLGDNRNNSQDSRFESVGNIKRSDLIGRAWVRIWPLNEISLLKHQ